MVSSCCAARSTSILRWSIIALSLISITCSTRIAFSANLDAWSPSRNVTLLVPASPGGGFDFAARTIQSIIRTNSIINTSMTVVNKPGGGGAISWDYLAQHSGAGNVLCISTPNIITNYITGRSPLKYSSFTPLAVLYTEYPVFVVRANSTIQTGRDLIHQLTRNIGALAISVGSGIGNMNYLALVLVAKSAGLDARKLKTVVFKGSSNAIAALLGGHIDVSVLGISAALPEVRAGKLRMLAVAAPRRMGGVLAEIPTWKEQGANVVVENWRGVIGPPNMSSAQILYWDKAFRALVNTAKWKSTGKSLFWETEYLNSRESREFLKEQYSMIHRTLKEVGLAK